MLGTDGHQRAGLLREMRVPSEEGLDLPGAGGAQAGLHRQGRAAGLLDGEGLKRGAGLQAFGLWGCAAFALRRGANSHQTLFCDGTFVRGAGAYTLP